MDSKTDNIHKTSLVLKLPHSKSDSKLGKTEKQTELERIRSDSLSALKIITMSSISGDEISDAFFSDYSNFSTIVERLKYIHIADDTLSVSEDDFLKNPFDCWMKVVLILFVSLYSFADHNGIECDVITSTAQNAQEDMKPFSGVGNYFSMVLRLELLDWSYHKVDLFVPSEKGGRMIFIIDNEASMYSIV